MNWLNSLAISRKLLLAFVILVLAIGAVGAVTVVEIGTAREKSEDSMRIGALTKDLNVLKGLSFQQVLSIRGLLLTGDRENIKTYREASERFDATASSLASGVLTSDMATELKGLGEATAEWRKTYAERQINLMRQPLTVGEARVLEANGAGDAFLRELDDHMSKILDIAERETAENASSVRSAFSLMTTISVIGIVASVAFALIMWFGLSRSIAEPIGALTGAMGHLANREYESEIPGTDQGDEVGAMARAVQVFKDGMIENERLQTEADAKQRAELERARTLRDLTRDFEGDVSGLTRALETVGGELRDTSTQLSKLATDSGELATTVATASNEMTANVQTVATATTELSASVSEIARQMGASSDLVRKARSEAETTNATVGELAEAAQRIGEIVGLIRDIADQTNLLALNATIESARAGDAGKGFAVVAQEVKALANQTAKATEDISAQIEQIQSQTGHAVDAIHVITERVSEIDDLIGSVAVAVEQQDSATRSISQNVEEVAQAASTVNQNVTTVREAAEKTSGESRNTLKTSDELTSQTARLNECVRRFLAGVGAA